MSIVYFLRTGSVMVPRRGTCFFICRMGCCNRRGGCAFSPTRHSSVKGNSCTTGAVSSSVIEQRGRQSPHGIQSALAAASPAARAAASSVMGAGLNSTLPSFISSVEASASAAA